MIYEENGDKLGALQFYVLAASYTPKTPTVWMDVHDRAKDLRELNQALAAVDHAIVQYERMKIEDIPTQVYTSLCLDVTYILVPNHIPTPNHSPMSARLTSRPSQCL